MEVQCADEDIPIRSRDDKILFDNKRFSLSSLFSGRRGKRRRGEVLNEKIVCLYMRVTGFFILFFGGPD